MAPDLIMVLRKSRLAGLATTLWLIAVQSAPAFEVSLDTTAGDPLSNRIRAASLLFTAQDEDVASPQDIIAAARADYGQILSTLYRRGFYGGTINILVDGQEAAEMSPFSSPASIGQVLIRVEPGRLFKFGAVSIAPLAPGTVLPEEFATGQPAKSDVIAKAAIIAVEHWRDEGHAKARPADQHISADHNTKTLDAALRLDPGPVVRFGALDISGAPHVRDERVRQIAGFPTGKVFSPARINAVADRLRETGTFSTVALIEAPELTADGRMNISLELVEEKPRRFGFGAEIFSREGLSLSGLWMHRNVFGGAENLRFQGEISGIAGDKDGYDFDGLDYRLSARLSRPGTGSAHNTVFIDGEIALLHERIYQSQIATLEFGLERKLSERIDGSVALGYRYSKDIDDFGTREFSHLTLAMVGLRDARDVIIDPTKGTYLEAEFMPYLGLNQSISGIRMYADARGFYTPSVAENITLAGQFQIGSIVGSNLSTTPQEMLFFSGGGGTVRGQPYQSLFVKQGGNRSGGLNFLGLAAEARIGITKTIGAVVFADAGFVGAGSLPGQDGKWHSGAGLGVRYDTGVGPIRLDLALPTSGDTGRGLQFYIGIGQAF